ncbi:MAG: putative translation factor [Satyrvirus sp.]|uniref:Putative translation factor n=1 Tax=Satyrvirus sp. TaxID=2487771 RepID=A0A3G5AE57_9VIRU|nr:MAG: putative translation factor [Satyrvirus sp.]
MKIRPTKYPSINDLVMVVPTKITDLGVYVSLLEYDNIEGLIILSDLSKSRIRSMNKVVSIGKNFVACVSSFDEKKQIILLYPKKEVSVGEAKLCENNYKTYKYIYDIVNCITKKLDKDHNLKIGTEYIYQTLIWPLSHNPNNIIASLKLANKNFDKVYENKLDVHTNPSIVQCFKDILSLKFKEKEIMVEAIIEINCYSLSGIKIIKEALFKGSELATVEFPFKIKFVKSPYYSITVKTLNQNKATDIINSAIDVIKQYLENENGILKIIKLPEIVLDKEFEPEGSDEEDGNIGE